MSTSISIPKIALCWVDIETTGLDYEEDLILEVAWQFTDFLGNTLTTSKSYVTIGSMFDRLEAERIRKSTVVPFVEEMHTNNGLWDEVFNGDSGKLLDYVIEEMHDDTVLIKRSDRDVEIRMAGSTVGFDKRFIETSIGYELEHFSHRVFDLSTLRPIMLAKGIDMNELAGDLKQDTHRAGDDIAKDIAQWRELAELLELGKEL